jgi:hypothetical protein
MNGAGTEWPTSGTRPEWAKADPGSMADSTTDPDPGLARVPVLPGTDHEQPARTAQLVLATASRHNQGP